MRRRDFLALCSAPAAQLADALIQPSGPPPAGRLLGTAPLGRLDRQAPPLERLLSTGLNARLFTDLSGLTATSPLIPNRRFFVRTACPPNLPVADRWELRVGGLVRQTRPIKLSALQPQVRPVGTHLVECAGNSDPTNFGLISEAAWDGIPAAAWLDTLGADARARGVLVSGADYDDPTPTSIPGASWIFRFDDLARTGAFFATRMNGVLLPANHGFPVRLIVPGWYGCACIKWVNQIDFVDADAPATSQMREYASRTQQNGTPDLAREYEPAEIDHAATPVRVEKWLQSNRLVYRIVGLLWGGRQPTNRLAIRLGPRAPFERVSDCRIPASTTQWTVWTHMWHPPAVGTYPIALRIDDATLRTRRLDRGFYLREVRIDQI